MRKSRQSQSLSASSFPSHGRRSQRRTGQRQFIAEALEGRVLLSTVTVSSAADHGSGSLRDAIANAAGGDTIVFANSLKNKTIKLTTGELAITKSLDIEGLGAKKLTVSGSGAGRVFHISGGAAVTIAGLTIADGIATVGGGILLEGPTALNLHDCALSNNTAQGIGADGGAGGAIEDTSSGALTIDKCSFNSNKAIADGLNLPDFGLVFGFGGGVDIGGPLLATTGPATISHSDFSGNQAFGGSPTALVPGGAAGGGAVSLEPNRSVLTDNPTTGATLTISDSSFESNAAFGAAGGDNNTGISSGQGGALNGFATSSLTVRRSNFTGNLCQGAPLAPGVAPSSSNGSVGGAIVSGGTLSISDSIVCGNKSIGGDGAAVAAGDPAAAGSVGDGGGVSASFGSTVTITGCLITNNSVQGGAGTAGGAGGDGVGGGIESAFDASLTVSNTIVSGNQAIGGAGGAGAVGGDGIGGGAMVGTNVVFGSPDSSTLTLTNVLLDSNQALGGTAGSGSTAGNGLGGGLAVLGGTATGRNVAVTRNRATGGSGTGGNAFGGGVYIGATFMAVPASVSFVTSLITANRADGGDGQGVGGGVYNLGTFTADMYTIILGNHASTSNDNLFT